MKRALITGASSGIGDALVREYTGAGWHVTACGRDASRLDLLSRDTGCHVLAFDMADREQTCEVLKQASERWDLVVLNAGTCEYIDDIRTFDAALFERVMQTNTIGTANCLQALLPDLQSGCRLALMGSSAVYLPFSRAQAYGGSKAALTYLAGSLATDLAKLGIGVSLVSPGFVETPLTGRNNFKMPMIISAEKAARDIRAGLDKGRSHVTTPWLFVAILRVLGRLPMAWRVAIAGRMAA